MTTRKQHYIWRHYLRPWATNEQIWCLRNGKKFQTNLMNIGQERDFYAVGDITGNDVQYISETTKHWHGGVLNEHNSRFVRLYQRASSLRDMDDPGGNIKKFLIQFEEDILSSIEVGGITFLEMMQRGKVDFFSDDLYRAKFTFFAMIQFVRTKRMSERMKSFRRDSLSEKSVNIDNVWPVEKYIHASHMAFSLFEEKKFQIHLLKNETKTAFITGDQPIFNTHGVGIGDDIPSEAEFYYPISPSTAVLISKNEQGGTVTLDDVHRYNSFVRDMSYEQIYAHRDDLL